jgi:hypothetical protein
VHIRLGYGTFFAWQAPSTRSMNVRGRLIATSGMCLCSQEMGISCLSRSEAVGSDPKLPTRMLTALHLLLTADAQAPTRKGVDLLSQPFMMCWNRTSASASSSRIKRSESPADDPKSEP